LALAAPPARHLLTLDDIMATTAVRGLTCSADGRSAAWVATTNDLKADKRRSRIWTADLSGGAPRPLTAADQSASAPAFSPDGS
ncbi:TolB family protein, partial [Pseudomonas aeruginosa]